MKTLIQEHTEENGDTYKTFAELRRIGNYNNLTIKRGWYQNGELQQETTPFDTFLTDDGFDELASFFKKYAQSY